MAMPKMRTLSIVVLPDPSMMGRTAALAAPEFMLITKRMISRCSA